MIWCRSQMPKVYNYHHKDAPEEAVYIGRGSPWGNPFVIGKDGDRDKVCDLYESWLLSRPGIVVDVKKHLLGKDLVCFCKPHRCHGDFLLRIANEG
jgi:hypothetical protein